MISHKASEKRIAIAMWRLRISPVFDTTGKLLIVDAVNGREMRRAEQDIHELSMQKRVDRLAELDVDVLLCGAISRQLAGMVAASGIRLVPLLTGDAESVLRWYLAGKPFDSRFLMPGCRRQRRRAGTMRRCGRTTQGEHHREEYP